MVNYECKMCNYITKNKSNHIKHCNTKKHLEKENNVANKNNQKLIDKNKFSMTPQGHPNGTSKSNKEDVYICTYCENIFSRANSLARHSKACYFKQRQESELKNKIKNLNSKVQQYEKDFKYKQDEVNYYKGMLMEAGGLVKKSVSALTYSIQNYSNAPSIEPIQVQDIDSFEDSDKHIVENILSSYKHKTLNKYLGDFILKLYKKDDPKDQSIWNTDDNRLTYLIKELLNNKSSNWIVDKKGIKTTIYLIEPLLEHIKDILIIYQKKYNIPEIGQSSIELEMILENSKKIIELVNDIDDGLMAKDILKYISSYLRFNDNTIK